MQLNNDADKPSPFPCAITCGLGCLLVTSNSLNMLIGYCRFTSPIVSFVSSFFCSVLIFCDNVLDGFLTLDMICNIDLISD